MSFLIFQINATDGAIVEKQYMHWYDQDVSSWKQVGEEATFSRALQKLESLHLTMTEGFLHFSIRGLPLEELEAIVRCLARMNGKDQNECLRVLYASMMEHSVVSVH